MTERNYEIIPPFDDALNARLNAGVPVTVTPGQLAAIKAIHAEHENVAVKITGPGVHDLQILPEDSMEARLEEARQEERERCARMVEEFAGETEDGYGSTTWQHDLAGAIRGEDDGEESDGQGRAEGEGHISPE